MKLIVADTGPLLHLHEAGATGLLVQIGEVHITPAVLAELHRRHGWVSPSWLSVDLPTPDAMAEARLWTESGLLDAGEAEALAHAREVRPDYFLTDDTAARTAAETAGLHVRGSLGVVLVCAALKLCSPQEAESALEALIMNSTLWLSPRVRQSARNALAEMYRLRPNA